MDFADWAALLAVLNDHRRKVGQHFEAVFSDPEAGEHPLTGLWLGQVDDDTAVEALGALGFRRPREAIARLANCATAAATSNCRAPTAAASTPSARA